MSATNLNAEAFRAALSQADKPVLVDFDFNLEKCKEYIHLRNPKATVIPVCAKTGEGVFAGRKGQHTHMAGPCFRRQNQY